VAVYPFIFLAIWHHNWCALAAVILWVILNPVVLPEPKSMDNWMSKGVRGEQLWTREFRRDLSQVLNILNAAFFFPALYAAYLNLFWPALYTATLPFVFNLWFSDRMVFYYEMHRGEERDPALNAGKT